MIHLHHHTDRWLGFALLVAVSLLLEPTALQAAADTTAPDAVRGIYLEARTADVYTGPCFANSEVNLAGREAVVAWRVDAGHWQGVAIDGLGVAAVLRARSTLGDPGALIDARAVLVVDDRADEAQLEALAAMARSLAGELLADVVAVERAPVELAVAEDGRSRLRAGEHLALETRPLHHGDHLCGNEEVYYPPLTETVAAEPAVTIEHRWSGAGLDARWSSPGKRSAFVGEFAVGASVHRP